jgi:hypothetical protein
MPRKVFVAGEILTAADVNTNLMDQAVMVFDDDTARGSAIPSPSEGMVTYLKDTNQVQAYDGSAFAPLGTILQVVSTAKTDTFTTTSNTYTTVTGLTASITPTSTSSKIMIFAQIAHGMGTNNGYGAFKVTRGGTDIYIGDAAGSNRVRGVFGGDSGGNTVVQEDTRKLVSESINFLDAPATASSVTYEVEVRQTRTTGAVFVNRSRDDTDLVDFVRGASSITLMEVAG